MNIILIIIGIIVLLDIISFIIKASGNASDFMYYLCRPLWGCLGSSIYKNISMFIGLLIRMCEVFILTHCIENFIK